MSQDRWTETGPVAEALGTFVAAVADTKFFLGRRVAEWSVGAPELESAVACAAVAQEELGHARVLYPLLADLPLRTPLAPLEREDGRAVVFCPEFLRQPWRSWPEAVVGLALVDTALTVALQAATSSAHEELARRACRIVEEERFHSVFAWGRVRALLSRLPAGAAEALIPARLAQVLRWLSSATAGLGVLKAAGVVDANGDAVRERYLTQVRAQLEGLEVQIPGLVAAG